MAARGGSGTARVVPPSIVAAARRGDPNAFMAVYDTYADLLRGLAYRTLGDPGLLDDAMQDVALKAFRGLRHFRGDCALGTWLYQITYHTCLNLTRGRDRVVPFADIEADCDDPDDPADAVLLHIELAAALASLSAEHRAVVFLVLEEGMDYSTAGRVLGVPPGTVASRLSTARSALTRCLDAPLKEYP